MILRSSVLVPVFALVQSGCFVDVEDPDPEVSTPTLAKLTAIDSDFALSSIHPGEEVGLFVEYQSGGTWHLFVTCDTKVSEYDCHWDVFTGVTAGRFHDPPREDGLEAADGLYWDGYGAWMTAVTSSGPDGFYMETSPGATVAVEAYLDGEDAHPLLFWIREGAVEPGAPTNPIKFKPTDP